MKMKRNEPSSLEDRKMLGLLVSLGFREPVSEESQEVQYRGGRATDDYNSSCDCLKQIFDPNKKNVGLIREITRASGRVLEEKIIFRKRGYVASVSINYEKGGSIPESNATDLTALLHQRFAGAPGNQTFIVEVRTAYNTLLAYAHGKAPNGKHT